MIQTCTSSTAGDMLTTGIQPLKALLGLSSATSEDDNLTLMLQAASRSIEDNWFGQPLSLGTYRETLAGNDDLELLLSRTPLRAVLGVFNSTSTDGDGEGVEILSSEYVVEDTEVGILTRPSGWDWTPAVSSFLTLSPIRTNAKRWLVEYTAGYRLVESTTTDGGLTSTERDLPRDIELAALMQAKGLYLGRRRDGALRSVQVGPTERVFRDAAATESGLFPEVEMILGPRRRVAIA